MNPDQAAEERHRRLARASALALSPTEYADVPPEVVARLRSMCLALPEAVENQAWAGTQWRIRKQVFAHVLTVDFADGPVTVVTFRSSGAELEALRNAGHPFFRPAWGTNAVGMVLETAAEWDEVTELVRESYCTLAPKKLVALLDRPPGAVSGERE
jgi:predicted DNA-binding protein (MmcQ/YjbR family)